MMVAEAIASLDALTPEAEAALGGVRQVRLKAFPFQVGRERRGAEGNGDRPYDSPAAPSEDPATRNSLYLIDSAESGTFHISSEHFAIDITGEGTSRLPVLDLAWISQVLGAARSVLVLDTCLSGDFRDFAPVAKREVLVLWSGCAPESDAYQGGIFTHHLLARFPARADFGDVRKWWREVRDAVRAEVALGRRAPLLLTGPTFVTAPEQEMGSPVLGEGERPKLPSGAKAPPPPAGPPRSTGDASVAGAPAPVDAAGQRPR